MCSTCEDDHGRRWTSTRLLVLAFVAALLVLSAANWAFTWLRPGVDTDALADRFYALLVDGMRGYSTPS